MSYTFSRRDFMKYSAVAAVAVAGSSMFTGCGSFSNPNRPFGTYTKDADCKLSFGGKSGGVLGFGGTPDYLVLNKDASYDSASRTLKLEFTHYPISEGTSAIASCYQLKYVTEDGNHYVTSATGVASNGGKGLKANEVAHATVTVTIPENVKPAVEGAKAVYIQYFPRNNALGREDDTYSDVYATWEITSLFLKA
ncbi:twin-arginine translocation signal domain-containing protein [Faecalibacterium prausnitzii]|uniref:twin-arginine translocation signal domain-containing protein n=1 Tax=Faecalibacterium TaxID=216851 RepID=UPI0032AF3D80